MDYGHAYADEKLEAFEREARRAYSDALESAKSKLEEFLARFEKRDAKMLAKVDDGSITRKEYESWRLATIARGKRYERMVDSLSRTMTDTNNAAMDLLNNVLPDVFMENANYAAFVIDGVESGFADSNFYDAATVKNLIGGYDAFPKPSVNAKKDKAWNRRQINSALTTAILTGAPTRKLAESLMEVAEMNEAAANRNARTAITAAENLGRTDTYNRAVGMGIEMKQQWLSTMDARTRKSHAALDGEVCEVGGTFSNGCRYPGDPAAPGSEIYNCRCTLVAWFPDTDDDNRSDLERGKQYLEWKMGR